MIAAAALPVLMGNLLGSCELPPECDGTQEEALRCVERKALQLLFPILSQFLSVFFISFFYIKLFWTRNGDIILLFWFSRKVLRSSLIGCDTPTTFGGLGCVPAHAPEAISSLLHQERQGRYCKVRQVGTTSFYFQFLLSMTTPLFGHPGLVVDLKSLLRNFLFLNETWNSCGKPTSK